jgi:hypothetical protein
MLIKALPFQSSLLRAQKGTCVKIMKHILSAESAQQQSLGRSCEAAEALGEKEGIRALLKGRNSIFNEKSQKPVPPFQSYHLYLLSPRVPALRAFTLGFAVPRFQRLNPLT